jgi:uncharacterized protein YcnI
MNNKIAGLIGGVLIIATPAFAHVTVTPAQSTPGGSETYKLRVPSEGGRTTTGVVLTVPEGVTVVSVTAPTGAKHEEKRTGERIVEVTWTVAIKAGARAELSFEAKNPTEGSTIPWKIAQKYTEGSNSAWSPVTKLVASTGEPNKITIPATVEGIFKAIHEQHVKLAETVKSKKLADVHHLAFAIRDFANVLPAKAAADKKAKVEDTVKDIAKLAEDLDKTGDAGNQTGTETNLKKLDGSIKELESQFGIKMEGKEEHKH